jgi:hypothetical protein
MSIYRFLSFYIVVVARLLEMLGLRHDAKLGRRSRGSKSRSAVRVKEIKESKHTRRKNRKVPEEARKMM